MERVLSIDPGEKVGWARAVIDDGSHMWVESHGITPLKDFAIKLAEVAGSYDTIIYETFRLYPAQAKRLIGSDMQTSQMIGMIRLVSWLNPSVKLVSQGANRMGAGEAYAYAHLPQVAEILARAPKSHDDAHDMSALAHLSAYYLERYA